MVLTDVFRTKAQRGHSIGRRPCPTQQICGQTNPPISRIQRYRVENSQGIQILRSLRLQTRLLAN